MTLAVRGQSFLVFVQVICWLLLTTSGFAASPGLFEIQVVDSESGRGVPLVELEMVNHVTYVTDSAGSVALGEPGLFGQTVFFHIRSHGYEFPKDGFGNAGVRLKINAQGKEIVRLKRLNIAERLYRTTGEGIYRDTVLLGYKPPIAAPLLNAQVLGQDSVQRAIYRGKIRWFWGDTLRLSYPLGNFRMSGAVSDLPDHGGLDPATGINLRYFTNFDGFAKGMFPIEPRGDLIWADGFMVLTNTEGSEEMIAHYQRLKGLGKPLGRGLAIYDDRTDEFKTLAPLDLNEPWRFPHGHPLSVSEGSSRYFYFGTAFPTVRVPATKAAILDPNAYEAFSAFADSSTNLNRDPQGRLVHRWTKSAPPTNPKNEAELIKSGSMKLEEAHFSPVDRSNNRVERIHGGTVCWNPHRKKWILIAVQEFGTSYLGEVWYSEADEPTGPWRHAVKIVTHDRYSFYNPAHHPFLDQEGGRFIYFEGTYTADFSGNPVHTPRYDYNGVMYRLDLQDPRLKPAQQAF